MSEKEQKRSQSLRLVTYNTNRSSMTPERLKKVFGRISTLKADVYGLEEYLTEHVPALEEKFGDDYVILPGTIFEDIVHHLIMVSRATLEVVPGTPFCSYLGTRGDKPGKHPDAITCRIAHYVQLQKRGGSPDTRLQLAVTQLDNMNYAARKEGNLEILKYLLRSWNPRMPKVYMGDLNVNTQGYASTKRMQKPLLKIEEAGFYDAWAYANGNEPRPRTFFGTQDIQVEGQPDQDRYTYDPDHIFVSDGIHCQRCVADTHGKGASDHIALYADVIMLDWE